MQEVRILTDHRVDLPRGARCERLTVPPDRFSRQLAALRMLGYDFSTQDAVAQWLRGERERIGRPVVLSFDDGYEGLYRHVFPLLSEHGTPALIFIVPNMRLDRWIDWGGRGPWSCSRGSRFAGWLEAASVSPVTR